MRRNPTIMPGCWPTACRLTTASFSRFLSNGAPTSRADVPRACGGSASCTSGNVSADHQRFRASRQVRRGRREPRSRFQRDRQGPSGNVAQKIRDRKASRTALTATRADMRVARKRRTSRSTASETRMESKTSNASFRRRDRLTLVWKRARRNPISFHPAEKSHLFSANVPPRLRRREFRELVSKRVQADGVFEFPNVRDLQCMGGGAA